MWLFLSEHSALQHFSVQDESFSLKHLGLQEDGPNALLILYTALYRSLKELLHDSLRVLFGTAHSVRKALSSAKIRGMSLECDSLCLCSDTDN